MKIFFNILLVVISLVFSLQVRGEANSPDLVVHLLDYLAKDYGGAVQNGKVISKTEYAEQLEFSETIQKNAEKSEKLNKNSTFIQGLKDLRSIIQNRGSADDVARLARKLQQDAILLADLQVSPVRQPDLTKGATLYRTNCVSCHGVNGHGDGMAGMSLKPKPANFYDHDLVWNSAPYKFFNTIRPY
jgi:high-affinity iron transporter